MTKPKTSVILRKKSLILFAWVVFIGLTVVSWSNRVKSDGSKQSQTQSQSRPAIVNSTLTRFGFEPAEFTIPAGRMQLSIRNFSGLERVNFSFSRVQGAQVLAATYQTGKRSWDNWLELVPGEYLLTEAAHPGKTCKISVVQR